MEQPAKTCLKCGSGDYTFRGREKIEAAEGHAMAVETKYRRGSHRSSMARVKAFHPGSR
jgi:hypothetical protein